MPGTFGGYLRGRELGRGSSGVVFMCERQQLRSNGTAWQFAAKAIDLRRMRLSAKAGRELKKLQREIDILRRVPRHSNLVHFIDSLEEGNWCFLILEFVGGGDLFSALLRRGKRPCFSEAETAFVLRQLIEGLDVLHGHGVIHRDLKLENILVASEEHNKARGWSMFTVKITDFGLSKVIGAGHSAAQSTVGSPRYVAPEVLATDVHDFRADLWSLGVLLFVLLAGRFPFEGRPEFPQHVLDERIECLGASKEAQSVVAGLLQLQRDQRLALQALRGHPWLEQSRAVTAGLAKKPRLSGPLLITSTSALFGSEDGEAQPAPLLPQQEPEAADTATQPEQHGSSAGIEAGYANRGS